MTSGPTSKIRLVRCPKCRKVLTELADVPVYECGGCGTVLQAKIRKNDVKNTRSSSEETGLTHVNELEDVSEDKESRSSSQKAILLPTEECSLDQNTGSSQNESGDCNREQPGGINFSNEVSSSTELAHHENDESSPVVGANSEVDENNESGSIITAEWLVNGNISSETPISQYNEQLEQSQKSVLHGFDRVRSTDTLETTELINPSSELSGTLVDLSKSPTTRSSHAYDGSVSSYDGTDDQVPDQHLHLHKRTYKAADFVSTEERPKRDKFPVKNIMRRNSEMQHQARNSLSISSDKKRHSMWDSDEPLEPTRHVHPVRNRMRLERDEFPSRLPSYLRGSQAGYENGSSSSHGHDEFHRSSSFHSPVKPAYLEQEKIKLLRMVYELQDQLNRTHIANGRVPTGVAWKGKQIPAYYNHKAPEEEICHDLNHPRHPRRCRQGKNWPQQCRFSGEATNSSRLQVGHFCLHCRPQDWQSSVQLPPPVHCCNQGLCTVHPGHNCYFPYSSSPSSPLRYVDSEFSSWDRDTKSDDLMHKDRAVKKHYLREKHHLAKRHFRPVAGGAPFITCYRCSKLLQLPADFLFFKRRCHRLRCSACSEVLKFSLQNSTHIVPYTPSAIDPPPSEVDDCGDAINRRNLASAYHTNYCPHADPVSCSEDYGLSFCKSCSTEGEPVSLTPPFHALQGNADNGKMPSSSSFEPMIERKKKLLLKHSLNKYKNPVETYESAGPSSNMLNMEKFSSEIEELPQRTGSPLHRLMGYSSPSEVINGSGTGTSSYYPEKNLRSRS